MFLFELPIDYSGREEAVAVVETSSPMAQRRERFSDDEPPQGRCDRASSGRYAPGTHQKHVVAVILTEEDGKRSSTGGKDLPVVYRKGNIPHRLPARTVLLYTMYASSLARRGTAMTLDPSTCDFPRWRLAVRIFPRLKLTGVGGDERRLRSAFTG